MTGPSSSSRHAARRAPRWGSAARAVAVTLAAVAPAALWGPSCLLGGFEQVPEPPPPPDPCARVNLPAPPTTTSADAGPDITIVSAMRSIDLGDAPGATPAGIDLDKSCTCITEPATCTPVTPAPPDIDVDPELGCDAPGGVDNAGAALFRILREAGGAANFGSEFFSGLAEQGEWSLLMRVRDYNGQPNDEKVQLDWFVSPSFGGMPGEMPAWDGTDAWPVQQDSTLDGTANSPKYTDPQAYVTDGVLIAAFPDVPIKLGESTSTMSLQVSGAFVIAELGEVDGIPSIVRGTLVGRWTLEAVFNSVSSYRGPGGIPFCEGFPFYAQAKRYLCAAADILAVPGSPTTPCDALSFGIAFTAHPAQIGVVEPAAPLPGMACPFVVDPANDDCSDVVVDGGMP